MTPVYEHRQVAWPTVIAVLASTLLLALGIVVASRNSLDHLGLLALIPAISVVVLAFFGSMTVRVFSDRVRIHFGIGAPCSPSIFAMRAAIPSFAIPGSMAGAST